MPPKISLSTVLIVAALLLCIMVIACKSCKRTVNTKPQDKQVVVSVRIIKDTAEIHRADSLQVIANTLQAKEEQGRKDRATMQLQINSSRTTIKRLYAARKLYEQSGDTLSLTKTSDTLADLTKGYVADEEIQQSTNQSLDSACIAQSVVKDSIIATQQHRIVKDSVAAMDIAAAYKVQGKVVVNLGKQANVNSIVQKGIIGTLVIIIGKILLSK